MAKKVNGQPPHRHGHASAHSPEYLVWCGMHNRCRCPSNRAWSRYGGAGIRVCNEWNSFLQFLADMGDRPEGTSLDRIDSAGPYSKENCRWATAEEQARNKVTTRVETAFGRTQTLAEWQKETGIGHATLSSRMKAGRTMEEAIAMGRPSDRGYVSHNAHRMVTAFGRTEALSTWSKENGVSESTIRYRLDRGQDPETAVSRKVCRPRRLGVVKAAQAPDVLKTGS